MVELLQLEIGAFFIWEDELWTVISHEMNGDSFTGRSTVKRLTYQSKYSEQEESNFNSYALVRSFASIVKFLRSR